LNIVSNIPTFKVLHQSTETSPHFSTPLKRLQPSNMWNITLTAKLLTWLQKLI